MISPDFLEKNYHFDQLWVLICDLLEALQHICSRRLKDLSRQRHGHVDLRAIGTLGQKGFLSSSNSSCDGVFDSQMHRLSKSCPVSKPISASGNMLKCFKACMASFARRTPDLVFSWTCQREQKVDFGKPHMHSPSIPINLAAISLMASLQTKECHRVSECQRLAMH